MVAALRGAHDHFIPIPRMLVAIKIKDPEKLLTVIKTLIDHYKIPLTKRNIDGTKMYFWGGVISAGELQPGFAVTRNYLVLSSNRQQIREFIRGGEGFNTLKTKPEFQAVDIGLTGKNNSVNYIDSSNLTRLLKEIISWVGTMIAIQDRDTARRSKIIIDQLINPLLDGMAMFSTVGMRSYTDQNRIVIESKIVKQEKIP